jgi:hypothetical protein
MARSFLFIVKTFALVVLSVHPNLAEAAPPKLEAFDNKELYPIEWQFCAANPVIRPGQLHGDFDAKRTSCCSVIELENVYRMYYWAEDANGFYYIGQAETLKALPHRWVPKGIVLERQPDKPHNSQGPCYAQVVIADNGPWLMYVCTWGSPKPDGTLPYGTNLALSDDYGRTWHYDKDEFIFPHTQWWNRKGTGSVCVLKDGGIFRAYFTSFAEYRGPPKGFKCFHADYHKKIPHAGIGYAESKDGFNWTYPVDHWIVAPRGDIGKGTYEYLLSKPWVIKDNGGYRMWCGALGAKYRIRSLTSKDGMNWTFHDDWIFDDFKDPNQDGVGRAGSFDDLQREYPMVIKRGNEYFCWYTGNWFGQAGKGYTTGLGFAVGRLKPSAETQK